MDILDDSALEAAASVAAAEKILKKAINEAVKNIKTAERKKLQKEQKRIAAVRCVCNSFACPLLLRMLFREKSHCVLVCSFLRA